MVLFNTGNGRTTVESTRFARGEVIVPRSAYQNQEPTGSYYAATVKNEATAYPTLVGSHVFLTAEIRRGKNRCRRRDRLTVSPKIRGG
jgi:hypothetical protein